MGEASALSALGLTIILALSRPSFGMLIIGPALAAIAGITLMAAAGHIAPADFAEAVGVLWRPMVAIASIMVIAAAAGHLGVVNRLAGTVIRLGDGSTRTMFLLVFCLGAATAAILNNDSAILVLTPLVITIIRRLYPNDREILTPFVFAVFMAAGIAPIVTSNPINLIVSNVAELDFNAYAARMVPVAFVGAVTSFLTLRWLFAAELSGRRPQAADPRRVAARFTAQCWSPAEKHGLVLALGVLGAYPLIEYLGGSVWIVSLCGAIAACVLCARHRAATPRELVGQGVAWQILIFLFGVYLIALGLRNAGAVDWLITLYDPPDIATIGIVSAVGSALINNHSMALTNIVAIDALPGEQHTTEYLAALVGGDLGPRLLPIGSLAGLLWYSALERNGIHVPIRQFIRIGVIVTLPSLAASLLMLGALS
ncbi:MAG: ArsB/NhaD family transporter [Limimaricola sp.]